MFHSLIRKFLILSVIQFFVFTVFGQVNTTWPGTSTMANVGIGTSTPGPKLSLYSTSEGAGVPVLRINSGTGGTANSGPALEFLNGKEVSPMGRIYTQNIYSSGPTDSKGKLIIGSFYNAFKDEITLYNGDVGIGNFNPLARLHVQGAQAPNLTSLASQVAFARFNYLAPDGNPLGLVFKSIKESSGADWIGNGVRISSLVGNYAIDNGYNNLAWIDFFGNNYLHGLRFGTNTIERMRISTDGNIGIGTTSPASNLHIENANSTVLRLSCSNQPSVYYTDIVNNYNHNEAFSIKNHAFNILKSKGDANTIDVGDAAATVNINLLTTSAGKTIIPNGQLIVGNITGANATGYALAVNGDIIAKKLKITQTGWADYVFDSAYQLASLSDVEQFIKLNHHLPNMPAAETVEKEGVSIGDNQALLLSKIEELTLYLINLDKTVKDQQELLNNQHIQIESLQKSISVKPARSR